jgi:large conductance mechanosensitive channel
MSMISEFKDFALKGNLIDTAVAFIMGGAFTPVVMSLVKDIIMPPVGLAMGGVDFSNLKVVLKSAADAKDVVSVNYGNFVNSIISFVILSVAIFMLVKAVNHARKRMEKAPAAPATPPPPARSEVLLQEIRDALVKR